MPSPGDLTAHTSGRAPPTQPHSRLLAVTIGNSTAYLPPPPPGPTTVEAAVALLRSARRDLLAQGALLAPISALPPNLPPPQPPVDDLLGFED
ncbi:hypothetical protein HPB52_014031 [Rhipicephalus sanguineus]|uniref:Uncharacterized protein n=1 Tax=Rhipicephalus sanguineus TaxID=34632 RepID=A0A9D4PWI3_RHISA|nr:hypothetical protein HPB52_014031 [Rhipicephalus sanguineus]